MINYNLKEVGSQKLEVGSRLPVGRQGRKKLILFSKLRTSDFGQKNKFIETNPEDLGAMKLQSLLRTDFGGFNLQPNNRL